MFCKQLKVESARGLQMEVVGAAGIDLSRASSGSRLRRTGPTCSGDMVVKAHGYHGKAIARECDISHRFIRT